MTQENVPSIEAALNGRIDALEKRINDLEDSGRHPAETASKRLVREKGEKDAKGNAVEGSGDGDDGDWFEIISVDSRTFERDPEGDRCKFSWKVVVQSHATRPLTLEAKLEFVDMDSYLVEEDSGSGFKLEPGGRGKFRGYKWISDEAEYQIVGVRAHLSEEGAEEAAE